MTAALRRNHPRSMAIGMGMVGALCWAAALAGPLPTPLIVALDLADHVVVGKLVGIEELVDPDGGSGNGVRWGRATVEVRETLKGEKVEKVAFKVATWVTPDYGGSSPPRVYKVGNEGILPPSSQTVNDETAPKTKIFRERWKHTAVRPHLGRP